MYEPMVENVRNFAYIHYFFKKNFVLNKRGKLAMLILTDDNAHIEDYL